MKKSALHPMPVYFDRYINKTDDVDLLAAIQVSIDELKAAPIDIWKALADQVYAPGKWTVRDILQHLIDAERVFMYRALAFARGDRQTMTYFAEDDYAVEANATQRSIEDLVDELKLLHQSFYLFYKSLTGEMLQRKGIGFKGEYSVAHIGFIMPGHQRWHFDILKEKYYPLVEVVEQARE